MIDTIVSAAGGYEKVSNYTSSISELGRLTAIAGVVGAVASPILGNSFVFAVGTAALGYVTWGMFHELSKDFWVVDVLIKRHLANHQAWLDSKSSNGEYSPIK